MLRLWRGSWRDAPRRTGTTTTPQPPAPHACDFSCRAALVPVSVAMFLGYGEVAPEIDRAVDGLVDTTSYVQAVLSGPDALTARPWEVS